jgi:hypothetical protein
VKGWFYENRFSKNSHIPPQRAVFHIFGASDVLLSTGVFGPSITNLSSGSMVMPWNLYRILYRIHGNLERKEEPCIFNKQIFFGE